MFQRLKASSLQQFTIQSQWSQAQMVWFLWLAAIMGFTALLGLVMLATGPKPAIIAWLIYLLGAVSIIYRPRYGLYLILFYGLLGDNTLSPWFPFVKNFSSEESILFLHNAVIISPLETYIVLILLSWLGRSFAQRKLDLYKGTLFWPAVTFLGFVIIGLINGIGTGGNLNMALWEARPLFYLVALIILASNLLEKREHAVHLMTAAMLGLFVEALSGNLYFLVELKASLKGIEAISEHTASVQMNTVFVLALAIWMFKAPWGMRLGLSLIVPFTLLTYLASQRRAAMIVLFVALFLLGIILFRENRKAFYLIVPACLIAGLVYLAVFWNSPGATGLPARAVKTVLLRDQASARDQASDAYRVLEDINTNFTVRQKPLTGIGFGQKFFIVLPMPDISFFQWWQYLPHNSVVWIWLKTGVFGFFTMLYLVGSAVMLGSQVYLRMPRNELRAIALTATLYIIMHLVFANVDISWDTQSMLYMGMMMGMLNTLERIVAQPVALPEKRWPWQPEPTPPPGLTLEGQQ